jgi:hypothetical protein
LYLASDEWYDGYYNEPKVGICGDLFYIWPVVDGMMYACGNLLPATLRKFMYVKLPFEREI